MPELPEVETSRRGIEPHLVGATILHAVVRNGRLRWPVSEEIYRLSDVPVLSVRRRAKYLLLELPDGWIIVHLGMSGSLRILSEELPAEKHDHVDLVMSNGKVLRYTASESLFSAGIHPDRLASSLSREECGQLVKVIKLVLLRSIEQGGTTLKDFLQSDGKPGYFAQELQVYGRKGEPCRICGTPVIGSKHAQRATFYCRQCQK